MKKQFIVLSPRFTNGGFDGYNQVDGTQFFCDEGLLYSFVSINHYNEMHHYLTGQIHALQDEIMELKLNVIQQKSKLQTAQIVTHPNGEEIAKGLIEVGFNKAVEALKNHVCEDQSIDYLIAKKSEILK